MRVAVAIISLVLMLIVGFQSCAVSMVGAMGGDEDLSGGGALGILVALIFLIGGAFAVSFPVVSLMSFAAAGGLALLAGTSTEFTDLTIWSIVAFVLSLMSLFGIREKNKKQGQQAEISLEKET